MPISGTSVDYTGRTVDISIMQGVNPNGTAAITPSFGRISTYCTGIQKLIQRYTIMLLTELGSQINNPTFGSSLLTKLTSSNMSINRADVFPLFSLANAPVITAFRDYQATTSVPQDEALNTAYLRNVVVDTTGEGVKLEVVIVPMTNNPVVFFVPLPN